MKYDEVEREWGLTYIALQLTSKVRGQHIFYDDCALVAVHFELSKFLFKDIRQVIRGIN